MCLNQEINLIHCILHLRHVAMNKLFLTPNKFRNKNKKQANRASSCGLFELVDNFFVICVIAVYLIYAIEDKLNTSNKMSK